MDSQTQRELQRITQNTPKELGQRLMKKETDKSMEDFVQLALKDKKIKPETKQMLRKLLEIGAFQYNTDVVDDKIVQELDEYNEREIRKAKAEGKLADPKHDKWFQNRMGVKNKTYSLDKECAFDGCTKRTMEYVSLPNGYVRYYCTEHLPKWRSLGRWLSVQERRIIG